MESVNDGGHSYYLSYQNHHYMGKADAVSSAVGIVLMLSLIAILCAIVAASLAGVFTTPAEFSKPIPEIIAIGEIHHENPANVVTYAGRLYLIHVGTESLYLSDHSATLYVNNIKMNAFITTLNGHDFISTHHYGVSTIGGEGVQDNYWRPGETAWFDFADQIILENDQVTVDIIRKSDGKIVSRSVKTAPSIQR